MKYSKSGSRKLIKKEDYLKEIIFDRSDLPGEGHLFQVVVIPPKTKQRQHYHDSQTEVFYILKGEYSFFINGQEFMAEPGDAFVCSPGDKHYLWNKTDEDFKLAAFKINLPEGDDTHWANP